MGKWIFKPEKKVYVLLSVLISVVDLIEHSKQTLFSEPENVGTVSEFRRERASRLFQSTYFTANIDSKKYGINKALRDKKENIYKVKNIVKRNILRVNIETEENDIVDYDEHAYNEKNSRNLEVSSESHKIRSSVRSDLQSLNHEFTKSISDITQNSSSDILKKFDRDFSNSNNTVTYPNNSGDYKTNILTNTTSLPGDYKANVSTNTVSLSGAYKANISTNTTSLPGTYKANVSTNTASISGDYKANVSTNTSKDRSREFFSNTSNENNSANMTILQTFLRPATKDEEIVTKDTFVVTNDSVTSKSLFPEVITKHVGLINNIQVKNETQFNHPLRNNTENNLNTSFTATHRPSIVSFFEEENKYLPTINQETGLFNNDVKTDDEYITEDSDDVDNINDHMLTEERHIPILSELIHGTLEKNIDSGNNDEKGYFMNTKLGNNIKEIPGIDAQSPSYDLMLDNYYNSKALPSNITLSRQMDLEDPDDERKSEENKYGKPTKRILKRPLAKLYDRNGNLTVVKNESKEKNETNGIQFIHVDNSSSSNALCMDGSSPGYYLRKGFSNGSQKWIVHLHGGAWCYDLYSCMKRRNSILGSTEHSNEENITTFFHGFLSNNPKINPKFFNWNVAVLSYCDGGLFSGNRNKSILGRGKEFYFRGRSVLKALLQNLRKRFLRDATDVVLSGTSAGGLALVLQGDYIRKHIPKHVKVRGLIDAGLFLDQTSLSGKSLARRQFRALYSLHRPILNKECLKRFPKSEQYMCLFPQNTIEFVQLPLFIVNSLYDHWQLSYLEGVHCVYDDKKCNTEQHDQILNFRNKMYDLLSKVIKYKNNTGVYADSCIGHGQAILDYTWSKVKINNKNIARVFYDWFNDNDFRHEHFNADCKYPCNGSCPKILSKRCVNNFKGASEKRRKRDAELC